MQDKLDPDATLVQMDGPTTNPTPTDGSPAPLSRKLPLIAIGIILLALFAASQVFLLTTLRSSETELRADFQAQLADLEVSIMEMSEKLDTSATSPPTAPEPVAAPSGDATTPVEPAGLLPRLPNAGPDTALGLTLATINGFDAYTGEAVTIDPADGTKRVWMAWAHWCPFCQQELPIVNAWWPEAAPNYPNVELITITTSIDPTRGNPLEPYLEEMQFTFPVVVDPDGMIAAQMGLTAFPFWMVTTGNGTVLYRTAGMLTVEQMDVLFSELEAFDS